MKPTLTLMVGLPRSGKSKFAKEIASKDASVILSSDEIRQKVLGDANDQSNNSLVFSELYREARELLVEGKSVIIDACNINEESRSRALDQFNDLNIFRKAIIVAMPIKRCIKQDKSRARTVGDSVIWNMVSKFEVPMLAEGFDSIDIIYNKRYFSSLLSLQFNMEGLVEGQLTLWTKGLVCKAIATEDASSTSLSSAALWCRVGKLYTSKDVFANIGAYILLTTNKYRHDLETIFYVNHFIHASDNLEYIANRYGQTIAQNLYILHNTYLESDAR